MYWVWGNEASLTTRCVARSATGFISTYSERPQTPSVHSTCACKGISILCLLLSVLIVDADIIGRALHKELDQDHSGNKAADMSKERHASGPYRLRTNLAN